MSPEKPGELNEDSESGATETRPSTAMVFTGALLVTGIVTWMLLFTVSDLERAAGLRVVNSNASLLTSLVVGLSLVSASLCHRTRRFFRVLAAVSIIVAFVHAFLPVSGGTRGGLVVIAVLWLLPLSSNSFSVLRNCSPCTAMLISALIAAALTQISVALASIFGSASLLQWLIGMTLGAYTMVVVSLLAGIVCMSKDLGETRQELTLRLKTLEGANEGLEAFVRSASHDLKAPLRHIATFCRFVQDEAADRLTSREHADLDRVAQSAVHMTELVNSLLDFAKLGSTSLEFEMFSLSKTMETVIGQLPAEQRASVVYGKLAIVNADRKLLTLVMQNLIENALKYVRVTDPPVVPQVIVQTESTEEEIIVRVADNGTGMERRQWQRIFEPGVRGVEQGEVAGTGYGLASSKRIVLAHGGRIWVDSEVGKGSTFHFAIPRRQSAQE